MPERKLPCDFNAEKPILVSENVFDLPCKEVLSAIMPLASPDMKYISCLEYNGDSIHLLGDKADDPFDSFSILECTPEILKATLTTDISLTGENRLLECPENIVIRENQTLESRSIDLSFQCRDDVVNTGCQENGLLMSSKFISTPLRLTGGGETSFEYQGNVSIEHESNVLVVNVPTISTPVRLSECEGTSHDGKFNDGNSLPWECHGKMIQIYLI